MAEGEEEEGSSEESETGANEKIMQKIKHERKKRYRLEKQVSDMENQVDAHSLDILTTARLATVLHNSQAWKDTFESKT